MFKKSAIALGLAMVAGTGMAAQHTTGMNNDNSMSNDMGGASSNAGASRSANAMFNRLDTNNDGRLSRGEASRNSRVSGMYDSLDTSATIEGGSSQPGNGISRAQFQAGIQAAQSGSGAVGPAVSGGETYTLMKDGSKRMRDAAGKMQRDSGDAMSGMQERGNDGMSSMQRKGDKMHNDAMQRGHSQQRSMQRSTDHSMQNGDVGGGHMNNDSMQQGSAGDTGTRMNNSSNSDTQGNY